MNMDVIDLFSGVGGMSLGFSQEGFNVVCANEIDKQIAEAYQKNHPNTYMMNKDITKIDIPKKFTVWRGSQVVIGGPPCQGFSQKGKRDIFDDPRNYLFMQFFEVVNYVKPKYFVLENVPNILTSNGGSFKKEIYNLFKKIGYALTSEVLNASEFGVPQFRRRAIIIGKNGDKPVTLSFAATKKISAWEAISDLAFLDSGEGEEKMQYEMEPKTEFQRKLRGDTMFLWNHKATKHSKLAVERMRLVPENGGRNDLPKEHLTKSIYSGTWGRIKKNEPSVTITTRFDTPSSGRFTHPTLDRAITIREAARLQGFPDDFIFYGSKSSKMMQVGNAVPPILAKAIANLIRIDKELENE